MIGRIRARRFSIRDGAVAVAGRLLQQAAAATYASAGGSRQLHGSTKARATVRHAGSRDIGHRCGLRRQSMSVSSKRYVYDIQTDR